MSDKFQQLQAEVSDGRLVISIGVNVLAFSTQLNESEFPDGYYIPSPTEFAEALAKAILWDDEQGATSLHRAFDRTALELFEQGDESFAEGDVEKGIAIIDAERGQ